MIDIRVPVITVIPHTRIVALIPHPFLRKPDQCEKDNHETISSSLQKIREPCWYFP